MSVYVLRVLCFEKLFVHIWFLIEICCAVLCSVSIFSANFSLYFDLDNFLFYFYNEKKCATIHKTPKIHFMHENKFEDLNEKKIYKKKYGKIFKNKF